MAAAKMKKGGLGFGGAPTSGIKPTREQEAALGAFATGGSLAIEAGAGTGKTSTLVLMAKAAQERRGQYIAFNKAITQDAAAKFPSSVRCNTAHSLAFRDHGRLYAHRLNGPRMRGTEIAARLGISPITVQPAGSAYPKVLHPATLASHVVGALVGFCQSADTEVGTKHFPYLKGIDAPEDGSPTYRNNDMVAEQLVGAARRAWADTMDKHGWLPYKHDYYLKAWELGRPVIECDYLLVDEAQDLNPVLLSVVMGQAATTQLILVGDGNQQIYDWMGSIDAMKRIRTDHRTMLSQSWRFGQPVAEVANRLLGLIGSPMVLSGNPACDSVVGAWDDGDTPKPHTVLCRTNATCISRLFEAQLRGVPASVVGGGDDVSRFALAAVDLRAGRKVQHPDLVCFDTWGEVEEYVAAGGDGSDLALLVRLVNQFGGREIAHAVARMPSEADATILLSTAHKAKGREWDRVLLAPDFNRADENGEPKPLSVPELRLLYVAVTRAKHSLDTGGIVAGGGPLVLPPEAPPAAQPTRKRRIANG